MQMDPTLTILEVIRKLSTIRYHSFKEQNDVNKFVLDKFYNRLFLGDLDEQDIKSELGKVSQ